MNTGQVFIRPLKPTAGLPPGLLLGALLMFLIGGFGPNIGLAALSTIVIVLAGAILWRPGEAPILLLVFGYQWFQASIATFSANWSGVDVVANAPPGADMINSIIFTLIGLLVLAVGMRLSAGAPTAGIGSASRSIALSRPISNWAMLYAAAALVSFVAQASVWVVPGLSQVMLAIVASKWIFYFTLAYAAFVRGRITDPLFLAAFVFEFGLGIGGFFSDFKSVFFVTALAVLASGVRVSASVFLGAATLGSLLIGTGIVWTAVKNDYRSFVSGGQAEQVVAVDFVTRLGKLSELVQSIDRKVFEEAADTMLRRLTYVEYFGVVLNTVPGAVPHENGSILLDSIVRPFMPRLFFPDKTEIDDTERTNTYTMGMAGNSAATSISLGWIAEMYIDFGEYGMFVAILLVGYFFGFVYKRLLLRGRSAHLFGAAAACAVLLPVGFLENSFTKVFGGVVVQLLVIWLLSKFVVPRFCPWLVR